MLRRTRAEAVDGAGSAAEANGLVAAEEMEPVGLAMAGSSGRGEVDQEES